MTITSDFSDLPINLPEQDLFGIEPFVKSLNSSLTKMVRPEGVVVAINGPWGSGKSSAINLLKYHLGPSVTQGEVKIVNFNPWWFRGEEALVLNFLRELYQAIEPSLNKKAKKALPKLAKALEFGSVAIPAAASTGIFGPHGIVAASFAKLLSPISKLFVRTESLEGLQKELSDSLRLQNRRFIVIVDDIDRLAPDEALAMFRLIKSVGRLPNVTYVLAFDREQAERAIANRFPNEGSHYLEKIIQVSFDLPLPNSEQLTGYVLKMASGFLSGLDLAAEKHLRNLFYDIVAPEVRTPRNAIRYLNALSVTWPAVEGEVNAGDFLSIEAYRLFQPNLHKAIRENPTLICGTAARDGLSGSDKATPAFYDQRLLGSVEDKDRYRLGLMRLFPRLEAVWKRMHYLGENWKSERRICVPELFPIYFGFSIPDSVVPMSELRPLLARVDDFNYVTKYLQAAANETRSSGGSKAALLLEALNSHAKEIPLEQTGILLSAVFAVADDIDNPNDHAGGFRIGDNNLRIHWLLRSLLRDRTDLEQRSKILLGAAKAASLSWLVDLANSAWANYHPRDGQPKPSEDQTLCTEADTKKLQQMALQRIRMASRDGSLLDSKRLHWLLYRWRDLAGSNRPVRSWTSRQLTNESAIVKLAEALISVSWSQSIGFDGIGDRVAQRNEYVQQKGLEEIIDVKALKARLAKLEKNLPTDNASRQVSHRFLMAWKNADMGGL
ncbi:MAG: NTPase [Alphaproteobacteria bacterium]|nr:NTPase [Alphaproteobacteria bacterium]